MNRMCLTLISIAAAASGTTSGQASGKIFQFGSTKMSAICSSKQNMDAIAADALGYTATRASKDEETRAIDEFALAAAPYLSLQAQSSKWRANNDEEGTCDLALVLTLPSGLANDLGRNSVLSGTVQLRMRKTGQGWALYNEFGDAGIPVSGFRDHFKPFVYANARKKVADIKRVRFEREQETALARKRAEADAEAAFKRDHPREWAAEQEQQRLENERRRKQILAQQEDERRKAAACEANGGTWGYKRNRNGMRISETGCFFQISE
jgi:hypothetical protein